MKIKTRFVKSVIAAASKSEIEMPWSRGARRAEMIARRESGAAAKPPSRLA